MENSININPQVYKKHKVSRSQHAPLVERYLPKMCPTKRRLDSITRRNYNDYKENKATITTIMSQKRTQYDNNIRNSQEKLNTTIRYVKSKNKLLRNLENTQIKVKSKNNARISVIIQNQIIKFKNQNLCKDSTCLPNSKQEGFLPEQNLFKVSEESTTCYEGMFSLSRLGATITYLDGKLYVYGGYSFKLIEQNIHLHYFSDNLWKKIEQTNGQLPVVCPIYHSAQQYRNYIIFIGGISLGLSHKKREFNSEINIFDVITSQWSKIPWSNHLRSHASTIYGNMLVVYGGINKVQQYVNEVYFISLNCNNICLSSIRQFTSSFKTSYGIAFHKMVNTYDIQPSLKPLLQIDGIISYGGKYSDGSICQQPSLFRMNFKGKQAFSYYKPCLGSKNEWQIMPIKGNKPQGRYNHSMNILNKKAICLIIGGINSKNIILNDMWIMDLCSSNWIKAQFDSDYSIIKNGLAGHSSVCKENVLYIFGGNYGNYRANNKFISVDFCVSRASVDRQKSMIEHGRVSLPRQFSTPFLNFDQF